MNAEHAHQLFGGEISDHFIVQGKLAPINVNDINNSDQRLEDIYNAQVKPVGKVAVTNSPTNVSMDALIERQPDPLAMQLQNTFSKIAAEHGLFDDNPTNIDFKPILKDQSALDLQRAQDLVKQALEELKSLNQV